LDQRSPVRVAAAILFSDPALLIEPLASMDAAAPASPRATAPKRGRDQRDIPKARRHSAADRSMWSAAEGDVAHAPEVADVVIRPLTERALMQHQLATIREALDALERRLRQMQAAADGKMSSNVSRQCPSPLTATSTEAPSSRPMDGASHGTHDFAALGCASIPRAPVAADGVAAYVRSEDSLSPMWVDVRSLPPGGARWIHAEPQAPAYILRGYGCGASLQFVQ